MITKESLNYLNNCSKMVGGVTDCYDDEIAEAVTSNRKELFSEYDTDKKADKFDVVVLDMYNFRIKNTPTVS